MSSTAGLMPSGITDEWRARARTFVESWYSEHFPGMPIFVGSTTGEWSKGAAIADALHHAAGAEILVLADADSYMLDPADLRRAIQLVEAGRPWVQPHRLVYRLAESETFKVHAGAVARLGKLDRPAYSGPLGGGITVVARSTFELVRGIDARFLGWGGEDVAFGWALETLAPGGAKLDGALVHLWHPHPAPTLRGSPASEELVAKYQTARGIARRMTAVLAGEEWTPLPELPDPVRFRMTANRTTLRLPSGEIIHFAQELHETRDPDMVEQLRTYPILREERRR